MRQGKHNRRIKPGNQHAERNQSRKQPPFWKRQTPGCYQPHDNSSNDSASHDFQISEVGRHPQLVLRSYILRGVGQNKRRNLVIQEIAPNESSQDECGSL